ncbi:AAA family ATPase [Bacillus testis]|uniref:AAA family ATPase n=1 Tax=Bacillus testis TaxID=1622072 RepID=UPI00067F20D0|nr:AAA family ATPase [Bacillus testis]
MDYLRDKILRYYTEKIVEDLQAAQALHREFLESFSLDKLSEMPVEKYALGKTKRGSFGWWLEYHTIPLGSIKGGSAAKHIIYYRKKDQRWEFPAQFGDVEKAWEQLRADILELIHNFDGETYTNIEENNLLFRANMLRGKILYLYHPDKFVTVYNENHLKLFLKKLGVAEGNLKGKNSIELNMMLKQEISKNKAFADIDPLVVVWFLYHEFMRKEEYWKIAPGRDAAYWGDCLAGGYISLGWDEVGDLTEFNDYDEFKEAFQKISIQKTTQENTEKANELWEFYQLKTGDKIIANKGKSQILAIGTVKDKGYEFREDLAGHKHVVYVDWDTVYEPALIIPKQERWGFKMVDKVGKKQVLEWTEINQGTISYPIAQYSAEEEQFFEMVEKALERKGQLILYGPPGTGKTYMARKFIAWKNQKDELFKREDQNPLKTWLMIASEKAETFRWEQLWDGSIQKWQAKTVAKNFKNAKKGEKILCYRGGSSARALVGIAEVEKEYDGEGIVVKGIRGFEKEIPYEAYKDLQCYTTTQAGRMGNRGTMFEINEEFTHWVKDTLLEEGDVESAGILDQYVNQNNSEFCTFHPSFQYEDFIEGFKPVQSDQGMISFQLEKGIFRRFAEKAHEMEDSSFYFIIDELNRGNVPKIFGEMITLLEKDKRGMEVRLPQSKDAFSIPSNLFLIGTMNTSDRSIKMMDAALKRRFAFIECMPDYSLISKPLDLLSITPADILRSINEKLLYLQGRDKQIGHAYFMYEGEEVTSITELKEIFKLEIIPLIQEYCFDDYSQLAEIIGDDFVDVDRMDINVELLNGTDDAFIQAIEKQFKGLTS